MSTFVYFFVFASVVHHFSASMVPDEIEVFAMAVIHNEKEFSVERGGTFLHRI